ncbi:hypothetical protein BCU94_07360 [Shewanella sp. 10N.286.52.C2]|uniref:PKD domain-containing protein n=1 Tax=Shewanella sp. 10N.286.52.C2 TaxID=1880838 RepID=UPI000C8475F1|nr:PKD domain-containing protein [Shewanella sp. 10N.286.52.C2]PMG31547.1 hypothetical protein BCU94_07360 [Shewanella sp. 10N.286.52.C2]
MNTLIKVVVTTLGITFLSACGGGGESSDVEVPLDNTTPTQPKNNAPVAIAGDDFSVAIATNITLDASASSDPDGDTLTYQWALVSSPENTIIDLTTNVSQSFALNVAGTYEFSLIVNDGTDSSNSDLLTVTVYKPNTLPVAVITGDETGYQGQELQFSASSSSDDDGDSLTYTWSFISMPEGSTVESSVLTATTDTAFVADVTGEYHIQLVVNDGLEASLPVTLIIVVELNLPPEVTAEIDIPFPFGGEAHIYSQATDPDTVELTYLWEIMNVPDGSELLGFNYDKPYLTFIPDVPGDYSAKVIVNDGFTSTESEIVSVIVNEPFEYIQSLSAQTIYYGKINTPILLDFSKSVSPEGKELDYSWRVLRGPGGSRPSLTRSIVDEAETEFKADVQGSYLLSVTASDESGASVTKEMYVTLFSESINLVPTAITDNIHYVKLGDMVELDARKSIDTENDLINYEWIIGYQPPGSDLVVEKPNSVNFSVTPELPGFYHIRVETTDEMSSGNGFSVGWFYVYENKAISKAFTEEEIYAKTGETITLNGTKSVGISEDVTVAWSLINSPYNSSSVLVNADTLSPTFDVDAEGKFVFQLMLKNGVDIVSVEHLIVRARNNAIPIAHAGDDMSVDSAQVIQLSASESIDSEGDSLTYNWAVVGVEGTFSTLPVFDNNEVEKPELNLPSDFTGQVVIGLTVSDSESVSLRDEMVITVD